MSEHPAPEVIRPDWPAPATVKAFSTTRIGGFSDGPWQSLNLGGACGDEPRCVRKNREQLRAMLPSDPNWLKQVHGDRVVAWQDGEENEADAITSESPDQVCAILTADCLPVLFCDRAGTHVAAAHAGWRGLAAGVLESTVAAMGIDPVELLAWMGPAIGPKAYEVGRDVYEAFVGLDEKNATAFQPRNGRWLADLYTLSRLALARVGVTRVWGGQYCTYSQPDKFFSYRRDRQTGRMATLVWLTGST
jgi:YfiH family protein